MSRILSLLISAGVIFLILTAGCTTSPNAPVSNITTVPATTQAPATNTSPTVSGVLATLATGTQGPGTCSANVQNDPANCGQCGAVCPQNTVCQSGFCYCKDGYSPSNNTCVIAAPLQGTTPPSTGCPAGMSPCSDGYCYELAVSPTNCGTCGNACPAGMICSASICVSPVPAVTTTTTTTAAVTTTVMTTPSSPGGLTLVGPTLMKSCAILGKTNCDGACVNTSTDTANCGTCGKVCKSLTPTCCSGTCVNLLTDNNNCGSCGHKCLIFGSSCSAGSCKIKAVVTSVTLIPKITTAPMVNPDIGKLL